MILPEPRIPLYWLAERGDLAPPENWFRRDGHPNRSAREETDRWLNAGDPLEIIRLAGFSLATKFSLDPTQEFLSHAIELRCEFFHCCIFAGNFTSLSTVQSYLCGD